MCGHPLVLDADGKTIKDVTGRDIRLWNDMKLALKAAKLNTMIWVNNVKKTVNYEEAGVVRNGKLEEGGVRGGKTEKVESVVISPDETGNAGYGFI